MDFQSLQTVVGILSLMKDENTEIRNEIRHIESKITPLMCKQLRGINVLGITHLNRRITPIVCHWCRVSDSVKRDQRDILLLKMMADLSCTLHEKYRALAEIC